MRSRRPFSPRRLPGARGATSLVELLVVISIIGILAALILPGIQSVRHAARRTQCQNNLRQIGVALTAHYTTHGVLPGAGAPSVVQGNGGLQLCPRAFGEPPAKLERQTWSWMYQLLPYLELENRWLNPDDDGVRGSHVPVYLCPSRDRESFEFSGQYVAASHYVGNACSNCDLTANGNGNSGGNGNGNGGGNGGGTLSWGQAASSADGVFLQTLSGNNVSNFTVVQKPRAMERIKDGLSNTVFVAEKRRLSSSTPCNDSTGWVSGYPFTQGNTTYGLDTLFSGREGPPGPDENDKTIDCTSRAGGPHLTGGNVLMGDGSVRFTSFGIDADLWRALLSVNGKEDVDTVVGEVISP